MRKSQRYRIQVQMMKRIVISLKKKKWKGNWFSRRCEEGCASYLDVANNFCKKN